jgi:hypothetical protein
MGYGLMGLRNAFGGLSRLQIVVVESMILGREITNGQHFNDGNDSVVPSRHERVLEVGLSQFLRAAPD